MTQSSNGTEAELAVVGAGPTGLTAALAARSLGLGVALLEGERADRVRPGSRALFVHQETLERLDAMSPGLGRKIAEFGIGWRSRRTFWRGREVFVRPERPGPRSGLPPYTSLRQVDTEAFLLDACRAAGVQLVWDARVTSVASAPDGVVVTTADGRRHRARYVIGADGGRSAVRAALGIELAGERSTDYRVAVDLADPGRGPAPAERLCHYRHPGLAGRNVFVVPFSGGTQVDVQCRDQADAVALSDPGEVRRWLPAVVGPEYLDRILWVARYPCLQLVAATFVDAHHRVLLAGEAAHLFAPLGARGMNSGIADADAAATAVALAARAANPDRAAAAMAGYDRVRRQAALHNRAAAGTALGHLRAASTLDRLRQSVAGRLAPFVPRFGAWLDRAPFGPRGEIHTRIGRY